FEIRERAARIAQNPKTMEKVPVPPKRTVKFKVGRLMKEKLGLDGLPIPQPARPNSVALVESELNTQTS
ncbi:MAG: HU family DNA-binding protein, partial [Phycisphaerales bacterium]|nr:HU family DNA-binding protein [Phycisphaerales bacterium]